MGRDSQLEVMLPRHATTFVHKMVLTHNTDDLAAKIDEKSQKKGHQTSYGTPKKHGMLNICTTKKE